MKRLLRCRAMQLFIFIAVIGGNFVYSEKVDARSRQNYVIRLTDEEIKGLLQMREEEKLARDVYTALNTKWNTNIFKKISHAEQKHMNAVGRLLKKFGIEDPVTDDAIGVFSNPAFENLFTTLVAKGSSSYLDALMVGAQIEDMDINDLNDLIDNIDKSNIKRVYKALRKGSYHHLKAFNKEIINNDGVYNPEYITQDEYDDIVGSGNKKYGKRNGQSGNNSGRRGNSGRQGGSANGGSRGQGGNNSGTCDGTGQGNKGGGNGGNRGQGSGNGGRGRNQ